MKRGIALPQDFSSRLKVAAKALRKHSFVRVISHYDADGLSAAGVMISCLRRAGIGFQATITKSLNRETIEKLSQERHDCFVFLDMGSGQIDSIDSIKSEVIILDHHKPIRESERVIQINPHFFGLNGMRDISASGLSFLLAITMDEKNWNSAPIAIAGLIGDMQNLGEYSIINSSIINGAVERKLITRTDDLRMSGENLFQMLEGSVSPYLKGISGDREGTGKFLADAELDGSADYHSLDESSKRKLLSLITLKLLSQGCNYETIDETYGEVLCIVTDAFKNMRIDDLTEFLNACGRTDHPGIGISACLGDQSAIKQASKYRTEYIEALLASLHLIQDGEVTVMENIQVIRPKITSLAGAICGISMQYLLDQNKPTIALSVVDGSLKVSTRGTRSLIEKGLDLSESLRKTSEPLGGVGGGHAVAAGATVPLSREEEFLRRVDEMTGQQLSKSSNGS